MPIRLIVLCLMSCLYAAAQNQPPAGAPRVMKVCAAYCAVLTWTDGHYDGVWNNGAKATLTVKSFTPNAMVMERLDTQDSSTYGLSGHYEGTFSDGSSTATGHADLYWPGQPGFNPAVVKWTATILDPENGLFVDPATQCTAAYHGTGAAALQRGVEAFYDKDPSSSCWIKATARLGDPNGQGLLAMMFEKGNGVSVNYPEALAWARKSADANSYVGERVLSLLYANGEGVTKDAVKAQYWATKSQTDSQAQEKAQHQRQLAQQHPQGGQPPQGADFWSILNRKTPSGVTGLDIIRAFMPSPGDSDLYRYKHAKEECSAYGARAQSDCDEAHSLRERLVSEGIDPDQ